MSSLTGCGDHRCLHEIMAVASLPAHENIVEQYRAWQQGGHFNIQMELCEGGSLAQLLFEVRDLRFQCQIKAVMVQLQC